MTFSSQFPALHLELLRSGLFWFTFLKAFSLKGFKRLRGSLGRTIQPYFTGFPFSFFARNATFCSGTATFCSEFLLEMQLFET
jgi:hypothetical protein